jgi:sterol desaturase/sphingolipid hydroxylase (fatty acid hydroxylase superfamily)
LPHIAGALKDLLCHDLLFGNVCNSINRYGAPSRRYGRYALITSEDHDLHHKHFNVNFGTLNFLDYLHGTSYVQSAHYVRDQEKRNKKKQP